MSLTGWMAIRPCIVAGVMRTIIPSAFVSGTASITTDLVAQSIATSAKVYLFLCNNYSSLIFCFVFTAA